MGATEVLPTRAFVFCIIVVAPMVYLDRSRMHRRQSRVNSVSQAVVHLRVYEGNKQALERKACGGQTVAISRALA